MLLCINRFSHIFSYLTLTYLYSYLRVALRNFVQRTRQAPSERHLSAMINFALSRATNATRTQIQTIRTQVTNQWHTEFHGLAPNTYDDQIHVIDVASDPNASPEVRTEFWAMH